MSQPGPLSRLWARLREGYEARLLGDAEGPERPARSYLVAAYDPETAASRVVLRGPRSLPVGSWLLRPEVLQFGLPVTLVGALAMSVHALQSGDLRLVLPALVARLLVMGGIGLWWNSLVGGWIFKSRWRRLREETYDAWTYRLAATREALRAGAPDDESARRRETLDELVRLTLPGR